jgi:hypothetical protein
VQEIIDRRGGNCNELAMVALATMKELNIRLRRVHENIYVNTPRRGETVRQMVKEKGNTKSVFGRHHNDHVWLEIYDSHRHCDYAITTSSRKIAAGSIAIIDNDQVIEEPHGPKGSCPVLKPSGETIKSISAAIKRSGMESLIQGRPGP